MLSRLGEDAGGEPVAGADRGQESAVEEFAEGGVRVGVADQRGQVRLVRHLAAECDRESQGGPGGLAQPGGEQRRGGRALAERGQRYLAALAREHRGLGGLFRRKAVRVKGVGLAAQVVALAQQGAGLDEAQRQALGLEPEVARPVGLLVGQRPVDGLLQQFERGAAAEAGQEDLFDVRVGLRRGYVGGRGKDIGALGRGHEQFFEGGPAEFEVVEDDDGADLVHPLQELGPVGAVQRRVEHRGVQLVEQLGGGAAVARESYDAVGGELGAVTGDGVEQGAAP